VTYNMIIRYKSVADANGSETADAPRNRRLIKRE